MDIRYVELVATILLLVLINQKYGGTIRASIRKYKNGSRIEEIQKKDNLSFEDARDKLLVQKIAEVIKVEKTFTEIEGIKINQGDNIRFLSLDDNKYVSGNFVGVKQSQAEGYTEHICIRSDECKVIFTPIEIICEGTLSVRGRGIY